jgi:hypothetical protein
VRRLAGLSAGAAEAEGRLRLELEAAAAALRVDMAWGWWRRNSFGFCEQRFEPLRSARGNVFVSGASSASFAL